MSVTAFTRTATVFILGFDFQMVVQKGVRVGIVGTATATRRAQPVTARTVQNFLARPQRSFTVLRLLDLLQGLNGSHDTMTVADRLDPHGLQILVRQSVYNFTVDLFLLENLYQIGIDFRLRFEIVCNLC
jgi:hypothetical protein